MVSNEQYLYLAVTNDEYELILDMAKTQKDLADQLGITSGSISRALRGVSGDRSRSKMKYVRIVLDEEE